MYHLLKAENREFESSFLKSTIKAESWLINNDVYCLGQLGSAGAHDLVPCKSLLKISVKYPIPSPHLMRSMLFYTYRTRFFFFVRDRHHSYTQTCAKTDITYTQLIQWTHLRTDIHRHRDKHFQDGLKHTQIQTHATDRECWVNYKTACNLIFFHCLQQVRTEIHTT